MTDKTDKEIRELAEKFRAVRPSEWKDIPDIHLYKDQVIEIMEDQHIRFAIDEDESLTPAMINNYTKSGLLPRAEGKRYDRNHIAFLTVICMLKQILPVKTAGQLLREFAGDSSDTEIFYEKYRKLLDEKCAETGELIDGCGDEEEIINLAVQLAVSSYVERLTCKRLTELLSEDREKARANKEKPARDDKTRKNQKETENRAHRKGKE